MLVNLGIRHAQPRDRAPTALARSSLEVAASRLIDRSPRSRNTRCNRRNNMSGSATDPVVADVHPHRIAFVNVFFVGTAARWVPVDAGLRFSSGAIRSAAARQFGTRPEAIVLTHGHFDPVGALRRLVALWDVPVYVHELELPYVTGRRSYPPPDPSVGGGMMSILSPLYPRAPIDVRRSVEMLPDDGSVPGLPGWTWLHTSGHTDGHIALFRKRDRTLISGDAVVTTRQESLVGAMTQYRVVWRPPAYYTSRHEGRSPAGSRTGPSVGVCCSDAAGKAAADRASGLHSS